MKTQEIFVENMKCCYPQKGENSVFKQAKSYVSCAIGKMS